MIEAGFDALAAFFGTSAALEMMRELEDTGLKVPSRNVIQRALCTLDSVSCMQSRRMHRELEGSSVTRHVYTDSSPSSGF